jgi:transcriptional regulator with PAS, ATPase and Fis domain
MSSLLVCAKDESVVYATGSAKDPLICKQLLAQRKIQDSEGSGLLAIDGPSRLLAIWHDFEEAIVFFIRSAEHEPTLFDFVVSVDFSHAIFNHFLNSPYESVVVVDDQARLRYVPPVHAAFLGIKPGEGIGKHVTEVIENTKLHNAVSTGRSDIGKLQEMGGITRVVARIPIVQDGKILGAIGRVMFKEPETVHKLSREVTRLRSEVNFYRRELSSVKRRSHCLDQIVGKSDAIRQLKADILKVAPLHVPVLIIGESGTGKELAAHAMHSLSSRTDNPMVIVNAAALPSGLVESELFGYEGGAYTGAEKKGRKGKFELANNGSLFLDEIGDMPIDVQVKLLRVLQDGMFDRVGGDRARHSDFRLISASNRDFQRMISAGEFRLDLYYRISGITMRMPSLRERLEDIPLLVQTLLEQFAVRQRTAPPRVNPRVYEYLSELPWPGNVRQLLHEVEKAVIFCEKSELTIADFRSAEAIQAFAGAPVLDVAPTDPPKGTPARMQDAIDRVESEMIRKAIIKHRGNKKRAAEDLGISRAYLYKKLLQDNLD